MLLHYHYHHSGHGFGSFFGKLFSKLAAKTVARTVARAAGKAVKVGARKAIKSATSTTAKRLAKKVAKKGIEHALKAGSELAINKIDSLGTHAINKGVSPRLVHNVSAAVKRGAHSGLSNLQDTAVKKINTDIDSLAAPASLRASPPPLRPWSTLRTSCLTAPLGAR